MVGARQEQHVLDHARQALVLFQVGFEQRLIFGHASALRQRDLGLADQVADRRAEIMRQVRREFGQPREAVLQPRQHVIEGRRQLAQLGRCAADVKPRGKAAGGDRGGIGSHAPQRPQPAPRQHEAQPRRHSSAAQRGPQHLVAVFADQRHAVAGIAQHHDLHGLVGIPQLAQRRNAARGHAILGVPGLQHALLWLHGGGQHAQRRHGFIARVERDQRLALA
ncbi:hypothetical protein D9M72_343150 [compost metagenome]